VINKFCDLGIRDCDLVVLEGSDPLSFEVGYKLGKLLERGQPVIFLHKKGKAHKIIESLVGYKAVIAEYYPEKLEDVLHQSMGEVGQFLTKRFTFFIPLELDNFLGKQATQGGMSRSEYVRGLIEEKRERKHIAG
jgi:hypothetical protein